MGRTSDCTVTMVSQDADEFGHELQGQSFLHMRIMFSSSPLFSVDYIRACRNESQFICQ